MRRCALMDDDDLDRLLRAVRCCGARASSMARQHSAGLQAVQGALNRWMEESGRGLSPISRVLAFTVAD